MITVQTYLYPQIVQVQFWDSTIFSTRNNEVYAKPVKVFKGIDNPVQVRVRNQDQRNVNMLGKIMQVDIQDPLNQLTAYSSIVTWADQSKGFGQFVITREMLDSLDQRQYKLTFRTVDPTSLTERPMFVDDNYGVPLDLIVLPAYYSDMPPQEGETDDFLTIDGGNI
jgi:hypothetical protein